MEAYSQRHVGSVLEITIDEINNKSIEELIDQGKRFTLVKEDDSWRDDNVSNTE